jgi:nitroreductase
MTDTPYDIVKGLRVVRQYTDEPIGENDIHRILEAGRWTGSSKNLQRWAFVPLRTASARHALAACGTFSTPLRNASFGVALVRLPEGYEFDIGRVAQNMMLAAASLGIGSCPVTLHDGDCAHRTLRLPEGHSCRYAIAFGREDTEAEALARARRRYGGRKPFGEVVWELPG